MKLRKLAVRNLASIGEADIDFAEGALASESLFLICGDTGAGKTTLLDAICLALYGRTPRFDGKKSVGVAVADLPADNVMQIVRRGAGVARAELSFRGNDGHDYTAHWETNVYVKGEKKGRIKDCRRYWIDETDHGRKLEKDDLRARAEAAVGLGFEQFLRTSMLAQGEFTRFLHADDGEKAEILEKLTDTSRFSDIGRAIHERNRAKQMALAELDARLEGAVPLPVEEKAALEAEATRLREENAADAEAAGKMDAKSGWLRVRERLAGELQALEGMLESARAAAAAPEIAVAAKNAADWDASVAARRSRADRVSAVEAASAAGKRLAEMRETFAGLLGAREALAAKRAASAEELAALDVALAADAPLAGTYAASGETTAHLAHVRRDRAAAAKAAAKRDTMRAGLPALESELAVAREAEGAARETLDAKSREIATLDADLQARGADALQSRRDEIVQRLADIGRANDAAEAAEVAAKAARQTAAELESARKALATEEALSPALRRTADDATAKLTDAEGALAAAEALVGDSVQLVISRLKAGDTCPICGGMIRTLKDSAEYRALCAAPRRRRDDARAAKEASDLALKGNSANVKAGKTLVTKAEKAAKEAAANAEEKARALAAALSAIGVGSSDALAGAEQAARTEMEGLDRELEVCGKLRARIATLRGEEKKLRERHDASQSALAKIEKRLAERKKDIEHEDAVARQSGADAEALLAEVRPRIAIGRWEESWNAAPETFERRLKNDAAAHERRVEARGLAVVEIRETEGTLRDADTAIRAIRAAVPDWGELAVTGAEEVADLEEKLDGLRARAVSEADARARALRDANAAEVALDASRAGRPDFTDGRLADLETLSPSISGLRRRVQEAAAAIARAEAALGAKNDDIARHVAERPTDLAEDDNADVLSARAAEFRQTLAVRQERIGAIDQRLLADADLVATRQKLLLRREAAAAEAAAWAGLEDKLGDADGKKLRKLLQSHVLKDVLRRANIHLRRLAPRYSLSCRDLSVTVFDADRAGDERPAKTLSGGEQFLVSLALALGLAGLNERGLAVDMLFVDEGFGSLGGGSLDAAVSTLQALGSVSDSRKVGIISHVAELRDRIPAHIEVTRVGDGLSQVRIVGRV